MKEKMKKENVIKRIVIVLILLAIAVFVLIKAQNYLKEKTDETINLVINNNNVTARLKHEVKIKDGTIKMEHGNKNRKSYNAISDEEKEKIKYLYSKSSASIRKFAKFYSKRSYSCIYNIIHEKK